MYTALYQSMIAWYARQKVTPCYLHLYAVTTMTSMAFLNLASILILFAHWNSFWAKRLLEDGSSWSVTATLGVALFFGHPVLLPTSPMRSAE
jgi:hypothetical protein